MSEVEQIILPEGFKRVEYLQSDRYQYIKIDLFDDGDKQLNNKGVWITWQPTSRYKYQNIFTCFNSDGSVFMTPHWNGDSNSILCGFVNRTNGAYRKSNYSLEFDKRYDSKLNYLNDGKAFINDTLIADINKNLTYTSDEFIVHLFGCNEDGNHSVVNSSYCKINRARITSGETITHDLIACLDADGRPCMYDLITNKPFYNEGIGEFSYEYSLPKGFKKVEYLQSSGTQWIDTGVVPDNETGLYLKAHRINGGDLVPVGARTNDIRFYPPRFNMDGVTIEYAWENYYVLGNRNTSDDLSYVSLLNFYNTRKASIQTQSNFYEKALNTTLPSLSHTIYIFDWNYNGSATTHWIGKIYEVKISQGENLVRHFIPCLDDDGVPCMYDLVNDNVYYKEGDGEFNYPRDYPSSNYNLPAGFKKCVYLQSDGTQWIDTGVIPDNETGLYFKGLQLTYGNFVPFGVTEGNNGIHPPRFNNKDLYYKWGGTSVKMMTWDKADDLIFHSLLNLYNSKIAKFDSEDTDIESFITSQAGTYTIPIRLFSYNFKGSYSADYGKWAGRIYRAQITQGTNLIHDYVPCLDVNNRPCMYDLIGEETLYNQSGGTEFTYCVEHQLPSDFIKLKYLESDSNLQHIKTGYVPTNNTGMYVDAYNTVVEDRVVMGMQNTTGNDRMWIGGVMKSTYSARYGWGTITRPGGTGDVRFEASLNWLNDKKSIITCPAFAQRVNTLSDLTFTPNQDIYIFGWNRQGSLLHWKGRIYRAKISEGSEIIRDFVPAYDTRKTRPCMYDLINNVAYYNDGTGEFLYNRDFEGTYKGFTGLSGIGNRLSGNCYHLVNALITDGNCRINLGKGIIDSTISHEFRGYTTDSNKFMFGTSYGGWDYLWQGNGLLVWGGKICNVGSNLEVFVTINANENKVILNGTAYNKNASFNSAEPVCIFDTGRQTSSQWWPAGNGSKFYKWVMKKDGIIIHDYRPAIDINFVPCVIDLITGEAFYNTLSGTFTWE